MIPRPLTVAACVAASVALMAGSAVADGTGSATAQAAAGSVATIAPADPQGTGLVGSTLSDLLQPVVNTLTTQINSTVAAAVRTMLNASGDTADTSGGASTYPRGATLGVVVPGVVGLALNGPSGSVSSTAAGYSATSSFSDPTLSVLGLTVADLGVASATATCPTTGSGNPSAAVTLAGVSLAGGLVRAKLATGSNLLQVSTDSGATYHSINSIGAAPTVVGTNVSVQANGNLLQVNLTISVDTLLGGLGLSSLLTGSGLSGVLNTDGSSLTLSLTVGPGISTSSGTSAIAWGLEVGADLSGKVVVNELSGLGVLGAALGGSSTVTIPSGIGGTSYGNILDLKLGYAACTSGAAPATTRWIPPGLI